MTAPTDTDWSIPEYTGDRHQARDLRGLFLQAGSNSIGRDGKHLRRDDDVPWSVAADVLHPGEHCTSLDTVARGAATSQEAARDAAEQAATDYLATT